ncbi:MAG: hypothetical protein JSR85_08825 [Proteobacteria bacterium]|nr:hypothetical protein [Pseudomonadota bacterium]
MKFFVLLTTCLLSFPHLSYAMDPHALQVKDFLDIPYEVTLSPKKPPLKVVEFTHKRVELTLAFDKKGYIESKLLFPVGFPFDLQARMLTAFTGVKLPEEPNPYGFGCLSVTLSDGSRVKEKLLGEPQNIVDCLRCLRGRLQKELLALRDAGVVEPLEERTAGEAGSVSEAETSMFDHEEDQLIETSVAPLSPLEPAQVREKVNETERPSLATLRAWFKRMNATVTTKMHTKNRRKIAQLIVTAGDHHTVLSSKLGRDVLKTRVVKFLRQVETAR